MSNSSDIFDPQHREKYMDYSILMMLRDPVDRALSEYYFLRERKEFMNLLRKPPESFEDYIENSQTHNYTVGFLLGHRIYSTKNVSADDYHRVIDAIENIPIHVGIFEYFSQSLGYFKDVAGIDWQKKMEVKRMTFKRPKAHDLDESLKARIREVNQFDQQLYDHCLAKFLKVKSNYDSFKIHFDADKYNHIFPYMSRACLFEFCMENKHFIRQNFEFFKHLTFYLVKDKGIRDGRTLTKMWNSTVVAAIDSHFPGSDFASATEQALSSSNEPLDQLIALGNSIDQFFKEDPKGHKKYYKAMTFNPDLVKEPSKPGFIASLFGKKK